MYGWIVGCWTCLMDKAKERTFLPMPELVKMASSKKQKKKKTGRGSLLIRPSGLPRTPLSSRGLNWTEPLRSLSDNVIRLLSAAPHTTFILAATITALRTQQPSFHNPPPSISPVKWLSGLKEKEKLKSAWVCAAVYESVHFSPIWYLRSRESQYALHPVSQTFPKRCLRNSPSDWRGCSLVLAR